ncbi:MAG: glycerate kinase [Muribaculaceae bacterium]|nr:glycerate kinase [Muribaculaceae bacterium]
MIAIASDKFKGTLSSLRAGSAISHGLGELNGQKIVVVAMADGGEGTAEALGARVATNKYYEYTAADSTLTAYIPSCGENLPWQPLVCRRDIPLRQRTSREVGAAIRHAAESGAYSRIDIGIGGTLTADGGLGMLEGMGYVIERDADGLPVSIKQPALLADFYRKSLRGLADVCAPLYSESGLSAMSFISQKGADGKDREWCAALFRRLRQIFPGRDTHGGAGGGIGFALESIVGCSVISGAPVILEKALTDLTPRLIITGEGRLDAQTSGGKTVSAVCAYASRRGIPAVIFCGTTADGVSFDNVFPCVSEGSPLPSDPYTALLKTAEAARPYIENLL